MRAAKLLLYLTLAFPAHADAAAKADLTAKTLAGETVRLKDFRGKLIVLNFWATWCVPCREEMPMLVKAAQANTDANLLFIAAAVDDPKSTAKVPEAAKAYSISFPVWTGISGETLFRLSKAEAVPATVFVDRDGSIQAQVSGQITAEELRSRIAWLTGDRTGPKPTAFVSHMK